MWLNLQHSYSILAMDERILPCTYSHLVYALVLSSLYRVKFNLCQFVRSWVSNCSSNIFPTSLTECLYTYECMQSPIILPSSLNMTKYDVFLCKQRNICAIFACVMLTYLGSSIKCE